jgi:2-oxoisovalerate dehydrogenase E1 component beta subunit
MEPKRIYRWQREEVIDNGEELPLDVCFVLRDGNDVTLVTWGAMVKETLEAADQLEKDRASAPKSSTWRPISPDGHGDDHRIGRATGRCVIVHEAPKHCGVGAEIAAGLADAGICTCLRRSSGSRATTRSCRCTAVK